MNAEWKKKLGLILSGLLIVGIAFIVTIVLISAGYTYLCEDDFSFEYGTITQIEKYGSSLSAGIHIAWGYAKNWAGTYLANFLLHFIMPYTRWGMPGFHLIMIFVSLLYIVALEFLIRSFKLSKNASLFFFLLSLLISFCLSGTSNNRELFLWYTGSLNYTLEMAVGFISVGCTIRIRRENNRKSFWILSSVFAILAGWGSLEVAGAFCAVHLLILAFSFSKLKEKKAYILPFSLSFLAALTNALAPGYHNRIVGEGGGDTPIIEVVKNTFKCIYAEGKSMFKSPIFIIICLLAFLFVVFSHEFLQKYTVSSINLLLVLVFAFLAQFVMAFPVILGLNSSVLNSMRTAGTYEILARLIYLFTICSVGLYLRNYEKTVSYIVALTVFLLAIASFVCIDEKNADWENAHLQGTIQDIRSGNLVNNYRMREYVLAQCENAEPGSDVVLCVKSYDNKMSYGMWAADDPNYMVNQFIAYLFELDSFIVYYQ